MQVKSQLKYSLIVRVFLQTPHISARFRKSAAAQRIAS